MNERAAAVGEVRGAGQGHRARIGVAGAGAPAPAAMARRASAGPSGRSAEQGRQRREHKSLPPSSRREHAATLVMRFDMRAILSTMATDIAPRRSPTPSTTRRPRAVLARIEATVDRWLQDDVIDIDTQRTGGLLELGFPGRQQDRHQHAAAAAGAVAGRARRRLSLQVRRRPLARHARRAASSSTRCRAARAQQAGAGAARSPPSLTGSAELPISA